MQCLYCKKKLKLIMGIIVIVSVFRNIFVSVYTVVIKIKFRNWKYFMMMWNVLPVHSRIHTFFTFRTLYNSHTTFLVQVMYYNKVVQLMYYIKEFQITYYVVHYSLWPSFVFLAFWHSTKDVLYLFDFVQISYYIFIL